MTFLGFGLIFVFLGLVYRHIHAVSPLIPIVLVIGWNSVAMYLMGLAYTPMTATLGSMTIGVAAEYTILVMERYSEEEERLHDHIAAIQESVKRIGTAITVSGLATFFGFSALCPCKFPHYQQLRDLDPDCGRLLALRRDLYHAGSTSPSSAS